MNANPTNWKMRMVALLTAAFCILASSPAFAQKKVTVKGTVVDGTGATVPGASVLVKDTTTGTVTGMNGEYSLTVPDNAVLVYSFFGLKTVEESVAGRSVINVTLEDDALFLDETVVIGYGTQKKGDVTSAVASVKSDDFLTGNIGDAAQLIKGKVAGLSVTKGNGDPKSSSSIMLRGVTSLMGGYTPLVLVDGIEGSLSTVAPENIEEISVLKDASAAAIYGTRGASGVILITTKTGKRGDRYNVSYSGYGSISQFSKNIDFMDAEYMRSLGDDLSKYSSFSDLGSTTDWLGEVTRLGYAHNHNISVEGGTKSLAYSANVSYKENQGVIVGSYSKDLYAQMDITQYLFNDILKLNFNMLEALSWGDNQDNYTIYHQAVIRNPTAPIYTADGDYYEQSAPLYYYNPVPYIKEHSGQARGDNSRLTGNITLEPIKGWTTNLQISTRRNNSISEYYNTSKYQSNRWSGINGSAGKSQGEYHQNLLELTSQYEHEWGKHRFTGMAGYSWMESVSQGFGASNTEFPTDAYLYNALQRGKFAELKYTDAGDAYLKTYAGVSSYKNSDRLIGFFGRITYAYDNRYNLLVSLRREGSSKFGDNHKWGNFPSVSAGWTISNEDWMKSTRGWLDNLKLRAGYGITGVIPDSSYMSLVLYDYDSSYGNYVDETGTWRPSLTTTQNSNPELKWETTGEVNVGMDFSMFDNRLYGSVDAYYKRTSDMLYSYSVPVPPNLYGYTTANVGVMTNKGIEVMIGGTPIKTKTVEWNTTFTASHNKNTLESLSNDLYETTNYIDGGWTEEPTSMAVQRTYVGGSIGSFYMLKSTGLGNKKSNSGLWMIEDPDTGESTMYVSGMRDVDSRYRQYLGSGLPKVNMGWSNTVRAYGFDLTMSFSSALGHKIFNCQRMFYENLNIGLNRYKSAVDPVYGQTLSKNQEPIAVSYYLENGDYVKLDNFTLGYTFNTDKIKYVSKARVYVSGENLFVLTKYSGIDPELSNSDLYSFGVDYRNKYPTLRTFTLGVNFTFGN